MEKIKKKSDHCQSPLAKLLERYPQTPSPNVIFRLCKRHHVRSITDKWYSFDQSNKTEIY